MPPMGTVEPLEAVIVANFKKLLKVGAGQPQSTHFDKTIPALDASQHRRENRHQPARQISAFLIRLGK